MNDLLKDNYLRNQGFVKLYNSVLGFFSDRVLLSPEDAKLLSDLINGKCEV